MAADAAAAAAASTPTTPAATAAETEAPIRGNEKGESQQIQVQVTSELSTAGWHLVRWLNCRHRSLPTSGAAAVLVRAVGAARGSLKYVQSALGRSSQVLV